MMRNMMINRFGLFSVMLIMMVSGAGCGGFGAAWDRHAKESEYADTNDPMVGRWSGRWASTQNAHDGDLRAIIRPVEGKAGLYEAWFWARWAGVLTGDYRVQLTTTSEGDTIHFKGSKDLGSLAGGVYQYTGQVHDDRFTAIYEASSDEGIFTMERVR